MTGGRVVVVLGYSSGDEVELHPVCAARLERAAEVATADDVVVLSGWARTSGGHSEAEHDANARGVVPDPWCDCCFDFPFDTVNAEAE